MKFQIRTTFSKNIVVPGIIVLILLSIVCAAFPNWTDSALTSVQNGIYQNMSWVYILMVSFFLIFQLVLAFSKAGNIKLGPDNSQPQYSFTSWIAMLFAAGMGIGIMYYGVAEPMSHYVNPALPHTANPAKEAQLATFFHWGIHAWGIFGVAGLILAYFSYRYKLPLAVRSGLYPLLKERINGRIGDTVDIFTLAGTFFGIATSLGLGVVQLNAGLVHLGILKESNIAFQLAIIIIVTAISVGSALAGVSRGVKRLSEINLTMTAVILVVVLIAGPTTFLLSAFSEGLGYYVNRLMALSFNTFAFETDGYEWFTSWTVMYWAWWISWSPFVGLFIAKISKGRTIREFVLAVLFVPTLFIFLWMTVFGNGAIYIDQHSAAGALSAVANQSDILLFMFFEQFPIAKPLCVLALMMIAVFFITSADSGILVINSIATNNKPNSPKWQTIFWGVLLAAISASLLYAGGIKSLQTMTLVASLPFGMILILLCFCFIRAITADWNHRNAKIPYGSRNWDGHNWKKHLGQILTFSQKQHILDFFENKVRPAFEELKTEFEKNGISAAIYEGRRGKLSVELQIPHDKIWNFRYGVTAEKRSISDYIIEDDNTPEIINDTQYIPVTYYCDSRAGNDIQYLSKDEIIADVLREYERFLSVIADDEKAIIFVDKSAHSII